MSRIRSIHPGILTDEAFMRLTVECPLAIALLVGLWMEADDSGAFEWKPLTIKARIVPAAQTNVGELLDALARNNFIKAFAIDGRQYGVVRNFVKYQRPKNRSRSIPSARRCACTRVLRTASEARRCRALNRPDFRTSSEPVLHRSGS